jgi:hypothetical protein
LEDRSVPATFSVTNTFDTTDITSPNYVGSLRWAINQANTTSGADTITFDLPDSLKSSAGCWWTIQPLTALPSITDTVALDGWSQGAAGYHGSPLVMLDGSRVNLTDGSPSHDGLHVSAGNCMIRGLAVGNFDPTGVVGARGVVFDGTSPTETNNTLQGCYIGLDPSGETPAPNCFGVDLFISTDSLVGGSDPGTGNVISGNSGYQLRCFDTGGATVRGNIVGLDAAGTVAVTNPLMGAATFGVAVGTGAAVIDGNVISGNTGNGIQISNGSALIRGNLIGTDVTGTAPVGNRGDGILTGGPLSDVVIGGTQSGDRNVISANGDYGIRILNTARVQGNDIGTTAAGATAPGLGNRGGIEVGGVGADGTLIGGADPEAVNLIAGNVGAGIDLVGVANTTVSGNVIRDNTGAGVTVGAQSPDISVGNTISRNSISANGGLGIDLLNGPTDTGGVTPNDPGDTDTGANDKQNFPVLSAAARTATGTSVTGTLNSLPCTSFRIEFFATAALDAGGNVEGQTYLGSVDVTTRADGNAAFTASLPAAPTGQQYISSTATNLSTGDTSEFTPLPQAQILPANTPPVASAGGPYTTTYGSGVTLDGSGSSDPDGDPLTYSWTINGHTGSTGVSPTLSWADLQALGVTAAGSYTVSVTLSDGTNAPVPSDPTTLTVNKADQSITFGALPDRTYGDADFALTASADSGRPVTFTAADGATVSQIGGAWYAHVTAAGPATITAHQSGDANYNSAPDVDQSFIISPKLLTASIIGDPTKQYDTTTAATLTPANFYLSGLVGSDSISVTQTSGTYNSPNVTAANTVTAILTAADLSPVSGTLLSNYTLPTSASGPVHITKSDKATVFVQGRSYVYDEQPHPATGSVTGVGGENLGTPAFTYFYQDGDGNWVPTGDNGTDPPTDPGYYEAFGSFAGNDNYSPASAPAPALITIEYEVQTLTDLSKAFHAGRAIPIKLQLLDASGNNVSSAGIDVAAIRLDRVNADGTRTAVPLQDTGNANPGDLFRYDATLGGYIFNLSTKGLTAGNYDFVWDVEGDPTERHLGFSLT